MLSITWYMTTMKKTVRFHLRKNKTQTKCACGYCVFVHRLMHWNIYGMFCIIRMIDFILESILMWFMFLLRALEAKNVFFLWVFTYFELIFFWFSMHRRRVRERERRQTPEKFQFQSKYFVYINLRYLNVWKWNPGGHMWESWR